MSDFIDRAKLEALADDEYPVEHSGFTAPPPERCGCDECYVRSMERLAFLAGAAAYADVLDAETTEEWGVRHISVDGWPSDLAHASKEAAERDLGTCGWNCRLISRRVAVTPWLPSKGGEKRG